MQITLDSRKIDVIINYKRIKNIYFRFDEALNLVVSAPIFTKEKEILKLIQKNQKSLENMLKKVEKKQEKSKDFWYLGNKYDIIYGETEDIVFDNGTIYAPNREAIDKFIKKQTKEIFTQEVARMKMIIDTPLFSLKIRKMKTRWGVCNYKSKTITLNSELIKYNIEDLRYVIVHEMCHFTYHDHSANFWHLVSKYYPNYKKARKDLKY